MDSTEAALVRKIRFQIQTNGRTNTDVADMLGLPEGRIKTLRRKYNIIGRQGNEAATLFRGHSIGSCPTCGHLVWLPCLQCQTNEEKKQQKKKPCSSKLNLAQTNLPLRTINALEKGGVYTLDHLLQLDSDHLSEIRNLGGKTLDLIRQTVDEIKRAPASTVEEEFELKSELNEEHAERLQQVRRKQLQEAKCRADPQDEESLL